MNAEKRHRMLVSAFVIAYLYILAVVLSPPSIWHSNLLQPVEWPVNFIGLWQTYGGFAFNKKMVHLDAQIDFDDGTSSVWHCPTADRSQGIERIVHQRYTRFLFLTMSKKPRLYHPLAVYIARQADSDTRHPIFIRLVSETFNPIAPLTPVGEKKTVYKLRIKPEDL